MPPSFTPARVLILAHRTADSPQLMQAVSGRAGRGPCRFTLLVPASARGLHRVVDPEDHGARAAERVIASALPLLSAAARSPVTGRVGSHEPLAAVQDALNLVGFDEVIVSMLPARLSRWPRLDLPSKIRDLGIPVYEAVAADRELEHLPAA
jgi:hypothetical protein